MDPTRPRLAATIPKRKRSQSPSPSPSTMSPLRLTTDLPPRVSVQSDEAVCESPRSKVALRLEGLRLDGGGVSKLSFAISSLPSREAAAAAAAAADPDGARKRKKTAMADEDGSGDETEIPETPQPQSGPALVKSQPPAPWREEHKPVVFRGLPGHRDAAAPEPTKSNPASHRLADPKTGSNADSRPKGRKRPTSPPLFGAEGVVGTEVEAAVVDPILSALTWHDYEITGYSIDDPDDDGEGINGVGFRPTPAQAEARAQRRRRQLADYRSRESKEARAKRSERRRGSPATTTAVSMSAAENETTRKVRFSDAESISMMETI